MAIWEEERRERFSIDRENLNQFIRSIDGVHKMKLDELMVSYICDNNINDENEIKAIRGFVKYLKEQ